MVQTSNIRRPLIDPADAFGHLLATFIDHPFRSLFHAVGDRFTGGIGQRGGQAFVEHHLPARWQIPGDQPDPIEVGQLGHRFGQLQTKPAVPGLGQPGRHQEILGRIRGGVRARFDQVAHAANRQQVADKPVTFAIPGKQYRATGWHQVHFLDRMAGARHDIQLPLGDPFGPDDLQVIRSPGSSQTDGQRLQALARPGIGRKRIGSQRATTDPDQHGIAQSRGIGPFAVPSLLFS